MVIYTPSYYINNSWRGIKETFAKYNGDINIFIEGRRFRYFYISGELFAGVKQGINEEELKLYLKSENIYFKFTYCEPYPLLVNKNKYIPVTKIIEFDGAKSKTIENSKFRQVRNTESASADFYFYKDRLIFKSYYHNKTEGVVHKVQPDSTEDSLFRNNTNEKFDRLLIKSRFKFYIIVKGLVDKNKYRYSCTLNEDLSGLEIEKYRIEQYYESKAYWEEPDFEEKLRKSDYYEFKAKLDKDFEEKKGYWAPKE